MIVNKPQEMLCMEGNQTQYSTFYYRLLNYLAHITWQNQLVVLKYSPLMKAL